MAKSICTIPLALALFEFIIINNNDQMKITATSTMDWIVTWTRLTNGTQFVLTLYGALCPCNSWGDATVVASVHMHSRHTIKLLRKSIPSRNRTCLWLCECTAFVYAIDYQLVNRVMRLIIFFLCQLARVRYLLSTRLMHMRAIVSRFSFIVN